MSGLATFSLLAVVFTAQFRPQPLNRLDAPAGGRVHSRLAGNPARPVYRYSVVRGGIYSPDEARRHIASDPVVAAHYRGIQVERLTPVVLGQPLTRYVSFRKGGRVYWTRSPRRIPDGEEMLSDGDALVRARCGNRLSDVAQQPTLPGVSEEPDDAELGAVEPAGELFSQGSLSIPASAGRASTIAAWPLDSRASQTRAGDSSISGLGGWATRASPLGVTPLALDAGRYGDETLVVPISPKRPAPDWQASALTATLVFVQYADPGFATGGDLRVLTPAPAGDRPPPPLIARGSDAPAAAAIRRPGVPPAELRDRPGAPQTPKWPDFTPDPGDTPKPRDPGGHPAPEPGSALLILVPLSAAAVVRFFRRVRRV